MTIGIASIRLVTSKSASSDGGGTAPMYFPDFPVIGKTGTTQTASDAWFVGSTPVMSTAVWVGHPKAQIKMYGATGGGTAAPIWRAYMTKALEDRKPKDFPEADAAEFVGKTISVPQDTGQSEQEAMSRLAKAKLIGRVQYQPHATVPAGVVIWASPSDEAQKGTTVYLGVSSGAPPPPPPEPTPEPARRRSKAARIKHEPPSSPDPNTGSPKSRSSVQREPRAEAAAREALAEERRRGNARRGGRSRLNAEAARTILEGWLEQAIRVYRDDKND